MRAIPVVAALSVATAAAGCGTLVERDGMRLRCSDESVNVISVRGHLQVRPERREVCRGYSVTLRFRNGVPPGQARTRQKAAGAPWLDRANTTPDAIVVEIPEQTPPGEYEYLLEVDGIGLLDPRIVVQ